MKKLFQFYLADINKKNLYLLTGLFLILMYVLLLIKTAWLGDDAYITFRTIDNFINGYGLRWNIAERVQSYTHPLWLFLLSALYFFTREIFFTAIITSIILSVATVYLLTFKMSRSNQNMILVLLAIIFSKAFIDYSTSGLENPLTNLLLVLFFYVYFRERSNNNNKTFLLSLISSLILVNRMDCILLVLPAFLYYIIKSKGYKHYYIILLGFLPFILWELFSLFYYGFPFPNTAYAKLSHGIQQKEILIEGLKYFKVSFFLDPITISVILLSIILSLIKRVKLFIFLSAGVILYLCYVIWVGGDFMAGRFLSVPFFVSLIILINVELKRTIEYAVVLFIVLLAGVFSLKNTLSNTVISIQSKSVLDERLSYYRYSNLLAAMRGKDMPAHYRVVQGKLAREDALKLVDLYSPGFFGFYVGSECHILDKLGICDPLLSRIPCKIPWRIGHFERPIPDGYEETLESGINKIKNSNLARYYDKISIITRGSLVSLNRFEAIWKINTGQFNFLIEGFISLNKNE